MKKLVLFFLIAAVLLLAAAISLAGEWVPVSVHNQSINSDGGETPAELAISVRAKLSRLRPDGKCAMIVTDHFDGVARNFDDYPDSITHTSISGMFIAIAGLELGSKWRPEPNTVAYSHLLALGLLPADYAKLAECYDRNTGEGLPLLDRFDTQQQLIDTVLSLGMLPVAAHPTQLVFGGPVVRRDNRFNMNSGFSGLRGVEMFNVLGPGQDEECVNFYLRLVASGLPVFVTAGSDYHGLPTSAVPEAVLGSLDRVTWVYADDFSEKSIIRAITQGKTYAACNGAFFTAFLSDEGQNPGLGVVGVDQMTLTAQAWLYGSQVKLIVYRNGTEVFRQEYKGSQSKKNIYALNCGDDFLNGWTDNNVTPGQLYSYVIRVVATTKFGEQTQLITSPISLRLRPRGQTAAFFDAIKTNNLAAMESSLATDPSLVNARDFRQNYDFTVHMSRPLALSVACALANNETVQCLLDHGAIAEEYLTAGEPGPLMEVACIGDVEKARTLLEHGADINVCTDGNTPLVWAIGGKFTELAKFLIEQGANLEMTNDSGWRPLKIAKKNNMTEIVELLLARGAKE